MSKISTFTAIIFFLFGTVTAQACTLVGERIDGYNKICTYSCISGTRVTTISSHDMCPHTISYRPDGLDTKRPVLLEVKKICSKIKGKSRSLFCNEPFYPTIRNERVG